MAQGYPNMGVRQKGNTNEGKSFLTFDTLIRIQQIENYNGKLPLIDPSSHCRSSKPRYPMLQKVNRWRESGHVFIVLFKDYKY